MSRDAKVGLVIVFAFVFLLGTILVHRMNMTSAAGEDAASQVAVLEDTKQQGFGPDASDPSGRASGDGHATTVDAVPADESLGAPKTLSPSGLDMGFAPPTRGTETPRAQTSPEAVSSNLGAHISVTDPRAEDSTAAVVEPNDSNTTTAQSPQAAAIDSVTPSSGSTAHSPPLLQIRKRAPLDSSHAARESPPTHGTADQAADPGTSSDASSVDPQPDAMDRPEPNPTDAIAAQDTETPPSSEPARGTLALDTPPTTLRPADPSDDATHPDPIHQVGGRQNSEAADDSTPPRLPAFRKPPEPTIESLPDRTGRNPGAGGSRSGEPGRPMESDNVPGRSIRDDQVRPGERSYVVQEGDSFWSISAKHYGTGKYFRALEEHNRDRLVTRNGGAKVLRAGTVIAVPDESTFKSSKSKSGSKSVRSGTSDSNRESVAADPIRGRSDMSRDPSGERAGMYRVQEGDSLSTIAERELGSSKRWEEIYQLNRGLLPDAHSLRAGMQLRMPESGTLTAAQRERTP